MKCTYKLLSLTLSCAVLLASGTCTMLKASTFYNTYASKTSSSTSSNMEQFKKALNKAYENLEPTFSLKINNNNLAPYSKYLQNYEGLKNAHLSCQYKGLSFLLTIQLDYKQAYKISRAIANPKLYNKLSANDIQVLNTAKNIVKNVTTATMSDYEKELALHDYIVKNTSYDYDRLLNNSVPDTSYTAAGVFNTHVAVCQGYSEAFKMLLDLCNIPAQIVVGKSKNIDHAWNVVKIDGQWYMVDPTFDDPITFSNKNRVEKLSHDYFNVTNTQLLKDHTWNVKAFPIATGTQYNFYSYSGLLANDYTSFKQIVIQQINLGQTNIVCYVKNYNAKQYNLDFIFEYCRSFKYSVPDSKEGTISIIIT